MGLQGYSRALSSGLGFCFVVFCQVVPAGFWFQRFGCLSLSLFFVNLFLRH